MSSSETVGDLAGKSLDDYLALHRPAGGYTLKQERETVVRWAQEQARRLKDEREPVAVLAPETVAETFANFYRKLTSLGGPFEVARDLTAMYASKMLAGCVVTSRVAPITEETDGER